MKRQMPIVGTILCWLSVLAPAQRQESQRPASGSIYIRHVTVIDTKTGKESKAQTVTITGQRITSVASDKNVRVPASGRIIDATGKYLVPGLWDMHVHATDHDATLPLYIANGVTGVREMFGPPDANTFRAELARKNIAAPHIYLASPIVDGNPPIWPNSIVVTSAEEAHKAVVDQKAKGADFIKVYERLSREAYFAIVEEARRQNLPVEGHVPALITAQEATSAKQKSIEHLTGMALACSTREPELRPKAAGIEHLKEQNDFDLAAWHTYSETKCQRLFEEFKINGTWMVPTLTVFRADAFAQDPNFVNDPHIRYFGGELRDEWLVPKNGGHSDWTASDFENRREIFVQLKQATRRLFGAGVPMLAGTDTGNAYCFPGFSLHDELALMVESGMTPLSALQASTSNAAIFMDATDRYGSVKPGKIADLVLLDADPLEDIHNTTRISEVFLSGKEFNRAALDSILKAAEEAAKNSQ